MLIVRIALMDWIMGSTGSRQVGHVSHFFKWGGGTDITMLELDLCLNKFLSRSCPPSHSNTHTLFRAVDAFGLNWKTNKHVNCIPFLQSIFVPFQMARFDHMCPGSTNTNNLFPFCQICLTMNSLLITTFLPQFMMPVVILWCMPPCLESRYLTYIPTSVTDWLVR